MKSDSDNYHEDGEDDDNDDDKNDDEDDDDDNDMNDDVDLSHAICILMLPIYLVH